LVLAVLLAIGIATQGNKSIQTVVLRRRGEGTQSGTALPEAGVWYALLRPAGTAGGALLALPFLTLAASAHSAAVVAVVILRATGFYNLSVYIGRNLPLTAALLLATVWALRHALPVLERAAARASGIAAGDEAPIAPGAHGELPTPSRLLQVSFGFGLLMLALSGLLALWGRGDLTDRLTAASLALSLGTALGGVSAVAVPWLLRPLRYLGGGWHEALARVSATPVVLWGVLIPLGYGAGLCAGAAHQVLVGRLYHGALAALATYAVLRRTTGLTTHYLALAAEQERTDAVPAVLLGRKAGNLVLLAQGITFIFSQLGLKITPILASLGVASLAVALALQDTLKNLFAGFYIMMDRSIKPGDFVSLDSGEAGFIDDIGWRNTKIRPYANNMIVIPNSKLSEAVVTNENLPAQEQSV